MSINSFIPGMKNELAYKVAKEFIINRSQFKGPVVFYGPSGVGKTHLMLAIRDGLKEKEPELKVLYVTAEQFVLDMVSALQKNQRLKFRNKYRSMDVLLVDDIEMLVGKETSQEEILLTLRSILANDAQSVVVGCHSYPKHLPNFNDRLMSTLVGGLPVA